MIQSAVISPQRPSTVSIRVCQYRYIAKGRLSVILLTSFEAHRWTNKMKGRKDIHGGLKSAAIYDIVMMITLIYIKMIELSKQSSWSIRNYEGVTIGFTGCLKYSIYCTVYRKQNKRASNVSGVMFLTMVMLIDLKHVSGMIYFS